MNRRASAGTPAITLLTRLGVPFTVHRYDHDPATASYGQEAADQLAPNLGVAPERVLKTLVARVDDAFVVAVVRVTATLDLKALATAAAGRRAAMAAATEAERCTGYRVGAISPFGQRRVLPTYLDDGALRQPSVLVSGGQRGLDLEVEPEQLVRVCRAVPALISRR